MNDKEFWPGFKVWIPALFIIACILLFSFASRKVLVRNTGEAFNHQQLALVRESAKGISESLRSLATKLRIAAAIISDYPIERVCSAVLEEKRPLIKMLFITDSDADVLKPCPRDAVMPVQTAAACAAALRGLEPGATMFITDPFAENAGSMFPEVFVLGVRIGTTGSWLCSIADFTYIKEKFVYPLRSAQTGYAWLIDSHGLLLAHPNREMEGRRAVEVLRELWPGNAPFVMDELINEQMVPGVEGSGEYTGWHLGRTEPVRKLIAYCPIDVFGLKWSLAVSAPYHEVMEPLMNSIIGLVVFLCCFIVIILVGTGLLQLEREHKRQIDQELNWSNEVFDSITDGISIIDRDYKVLMVNRAISHWHGQYKSAFHGQPCYAVFQQHQQHCQGCPAREAFATGLPAFRKGVATVVGDQKYYFDLTAFPLRDAQGNTVKVAELVKDVTREVMLQNELLQHERKDMIVKMAAQIAHEIRNPLGALTLNIDLLEDEIGGLADGTEVASLLSTIKQELDALNRVLQEYLECARFPRINQSRQDLHAIIEDLFGLLEQDLRRRRILCTRSFEYNLPAAWIDPDQIRRAFLNILRNAMDALPDGGSLTVATRCDDDTVTVMFSDTGEGMPAEVVDKIFTPFFTTKSGGTGLGLSITQHIISEHRGEITCESTPGQGSTFTVILPRAHASLESGHSEPADGTNDHGAA
ncbi:MAG: PAS domain-containing protein [Deltaproteobacteria bacterium]|nr:PAS domain-containing protein [Deltaproteobacteria bacterium]